MSFAYLPWYTGDYFRDTRGLSMAGHGCYLLLLAFCWDSTGPLPLDPEEIATICGARSQEERATMERVLGRYFVRMEDGWYNSRLQREIERSENISRARSEAGKRGYQAKAKQLPSKSLASASIPTTITNTITNTKEVQERVARATRLPTDWELPDEWNAWACKAYNLEPHRVVLISLVFRDHFLGAPNNKGGLKVSWLATWRKWIHKEMQNA